MKCRITKEVPGNTNTVNAISSCVFFSFPEVPRVLVCAPESQRGSQLLVGWGEVEGLGRLVSLTVQMLS